MTARTQRRLLAGFVALAALIAIVVAGPTGAAPARHGELILFERQNGTAGAAAIYVVAPDGTELRRLTPDSASSDPAWSPDRKRIAFVSGRHGAHWAPDLYVMNADGRNVRRLTRGPANSRLFYASADPAWTPDGKQIIFGRTLVRRGGKVENDLWIIGADGRGLRRLTTTPKQHEASPSVSPYGMLAFVRDGEIRVKLLAEPNSKGIARGESPAWSPEGSTLAFSRAGYVYTVRSDGSELTRIGTGSGPSWSSDAVRLVFSAPTGLVTTFPSGADLREVTRRESPSADLDASWSSPRPQRPRGYAAARADTGIVYSAGAGRNAELYVREPSGDVRRLTNNRAYEGFPAWSPDRKRIAFVSNRGGTSSDIYVMRADGTNVRRIVRGRGHDLYPAWSPDGKRIVFSSNRASTEAEIFVVDADGTKLRRLTRTPGYVDDTQPQFSPDGRYIVFTSNRIAYWNYEVFRMRASDGGALTRLTRWGSGADGAPGDDIAPSYSPDGRRIVFISDRNGGYAVWTMNANGRGLREVVRHRGLNHSLPRFSPDGNSIVYITFSPDGDGSDSLLHTVRVDGTGHVALGHATEADW